MDCCSDTNKDTKNSVRQGILYALVPHIGCIAFIIGSVLGVTVLMNVFKPMLMNRYFFHWLFVIALGFATLSSFLYLKKHQSLNWEGIKKKKGYLSIMYGSTIGINLILFLFIFPFLANFSLAGNVVYNEDLASSLTLEVDIPCPGHAPLISEELKTIQGVYDVEFSFPNKFLVNYGTETNEQEILGLDVFNTYAATLIDSSGDPIQTTEVTNAAAGSCSGGCGGAGTCGGSCGSPSCDYNK